MTGSSLTRIFKVESELEAPSRRALFKLTGLAGAGLVLGSYFPAQTAQAQTVSSAAGKAFAPNPFLIVAPDNTVTVIIKHLDKGQGAATGLATLVAEELDAAWDQIRTDFAPADADKYKNFAFGVQGVGGSTGLANSFEQYRQAGAAARGMLVAAAARAWGVPASEIKVANGVLTQGRNSATFGALAEKAAAESVPQAPVLKTPDKFVYIGKQFPRVDAKAKSTGTAKFTFDVELPDMLVATIVHPPKFGATVKSFDANAAKKIDGVTDVVAISRGVAVVAKTSWAALKGRDAVKVEWDFSKAETRGTEELRAEYAALLEKDGTNVRTQGDVTGAFAQAAKVIEAAFEFPYLAHAPMEPMNAVARFDGTIGEVWTGSQLQTVDQGVAAGVLGIKPENMRIHTVWAGGSFGRRAVADSHYIVEALEIVKALKTKAPVKLIWTRDNDIRGGYYRPFYLHKIKAGLDTKGSIVAWQHRIVGQSIADGTPFAVGMLKNGYDETSVEGAKNLPYAIPNFKLDLHTPSVKVPVLWWRSVGSTHTAHATEHMIDILARETGQDPVAYRLAMLKDNPRHAEVLKLAAIKADWGKPLKPGTARGVAVHESFSSFVAQVADVSIDANGAYKVERVVCAVDCGLAVNPDVVTAQMEGGIGYGLGAALTSAITVKDGAVEQSNFDDYEVLRMSQMPRIETHIVPSTQKPTGVGEPGTPVVLPAVANALLAATGVRTLMLPMSRQSYKKEA